MTTLRLLLCLCASSLLAADTTINNLRLQSDAKGAGTNSWNGVRNYGGYSANLTNGQFTLQTNSQMTLGGSTNENTGVASALIGTAVTTNVINQVTSPNSLGVFYGEADDPARRVTNRLSGAGAANIFAAHNLNISGSSTNSISIDGNASGNIFAAAYENLVFGAGQNFQRIRGETYGNVVASAAFISGHLDFLGGYGSIISSVSTGGTNSIFGATASILALDNDASYTDIDAAFTMAVSYTGTSSHTGITNAYGGIIYSRNTGGTNILKGGGFTGIKTETASVVRENKLSGFFSGYAANGHTLTTSADEGINLISIADTLYGSSSVSGTGATLIGTGTNAYPYSQWIGYQPAGEQPRLMIRTNGVGIRTNSPQAALHVAGDALIESSIVLSNINRRVPGHKILTDAATSLVFTNTTPTNSFCAGRCEYVVRVQNNVPEWQAEFGSVDWVSVNTNGVFTTTVTEHDSSQTLMTGTLTTVWTATSTFGTNLILNLVADSSLTVTNMTIDYVLHGLGEMATSKLLP